MFKKTGALRGKFKFLAKRAVPTAILTLAAVISFSSLFTAQNVYVITDDNNTIIHTTSEKNADAALKEAGIRVAPGDIVSIPRGNVLGVSAINIKRSKEVSVVQGNKIIETQFHSETVASLLERLEIVLEPGDTVTPSLEVQLEDGDIITIRRNNVKTVTVEETAWYVQQRVPSLYIDKGTEIQISPGVNGKKLVTYEIFEQDGTEVYRNPVAEAIIVPPSDEIIEYGCGGTITAPDGTQLNFTRMIDVTATAYTTENSRNKRTALGTTARVGAIAVDPKVIPLRTKVYVESRDGSWTYGESVCEDTGGAIKGNIIDLFFDTRKECYTFGRKPARLYILE